MFSKAYLILICVFITVWPLQAASDDIAVIVNKRYPVDAATILEIKKIFLGYKEYEGGLKIVPVDQEGEIRNRFVKKVLSLSIEQYTGYWLKKVFQEGTVPPLTKANSKEVIDTVLRENSAIGYVWLEEAKGKAGIKVILIVKAD